MFFFDGCHIYVLLKQKEYFLASIYFVPFSVCNIFLALASIVIG